MRELSATLLQAQLAPSRRPVVSVEVQDFGHPAQSSQVQWQPFGWQRFYQGSEPKAYHGVAVSGDGSLHRVRLEGTAIKYSRVTSPGPGSNYSTWSSGSTWGSTTSNGRVAIAAQGAEVLAVSMDASYLYYKRSTDSGATWGSWTAMTNTRPCERGVAVAFKSNGDCAIVHASDVDDPKSLYIQRRTSGTWSTGLGQRSGDWEISHLAMYYDGDWNIIALVTEGSYLSVVRMVYGDGYRQTAGTWATDQKIGLGRARLDIDAQMALRQFGSQWRFGGASRHTPTYWEKQQAVLQELAGETLDVSGPFIAKPASYQALLSLARQDQPWLFRLKPGTDFYDYNWNKASTIGTQAAYGMAIACHANYIWATQANEVWRSPLPSYWQPPTAGSGAGTYISIPQSRLLSVVEQVEPEQASQLTVVLENSDGYFNSPGVAPIGQVKRGSRVNLKIGYSTTSGDETSECGRYFIESWQYERAKNRATFTMNCIDAWGLLERYRFDKPVEWNASSDESTCYQLIEKVMSAIGGTLGYKSRSSLITSIYPKLEVNAGESGASVLRRLLALVPDVIFFFGLDAYIVYPQASDSPTYHYAHPQVLQRRIAASSDDTLVRWTGTAWAISLTASASAGYYNEANFKRGIGMRFTNVTIPNGASIVSAYLTFTAEYTRTATTVRSRIRGQDSDNAAAFSTYADYSSRSRTTAEVTWDGIPAWTLDLQYKSPDIKDVIQEIVDRPGWASGNALVVFWDDHEGRSDPVGYCERRAYTYDSSPIKSPELTVIFAHPILDGTYLSHTPDINRAHVIGRDIYGNPVFGTATNSDEIALVGERLDFQQELSIPTETLAGSVAQAIIDKARLNTKGGSILVPPNCGQELWDVVGINDSTANQDNMKYRVAGIRLDYNPKQATYLHTFALAGV